MNTIRELKQQEKYKNMLKRKNKEKKIYKDKNASLQFEKQKLYITLLNREKEIERLKSIIKEVREYIENGNYRFREGTDICLYQEGNEVFYMENDELMARKILSILEKENKDGER